MTLRLTLGIDPGQTGAVAALADGRPAGFIDMPLKPRPNGKGMMIDCFALRRDLRDLLRDHSGAYVFGVMEKVGAVPVQGRKQGGQSSFNFGQADGMVRATLTCLDVPFIEVFPQTWKKYLRLTGCDKDAARTLVLQRFPEISDHLRRKKDVGRADALLIALWSELTEQVARKVA